MEIELDILYLDLILTFVLNLSLDPNLDLQRQNLVIFKVRTLKFCIEVDIDIP